MSQYTVLWYSENPLLQRYQNSFYCKLYNTYKNVCELYSISIIWFDNIWFRNFLLHPDISSLLIEYITVNCKHSLKLFLKEYTYFVKNDTKLSQWEYVSIKGTDIILTLHDNNPKNHIVNHPDHNSEWMLGWGERDISEWGNVFNKTFDLLKDIDKEFYEEIGMMIQKIIPMKTSKWLHNSCSFNNCIWSLYLWYTIDAERPEINMLEAIIHESSHNKLNLILHSDTLLYNKSEFIYYSPYRPDARHLMWVLLWVHAIVPTVHTLLCAVDLWYITDELWFKKVWLLHYKNIMWFKVLQKYAKASEVWNTVIRELWEVISLCDSRINNSKYKNKIKSSTTLSEFKKHFLAVKESYPSLRY